MKAQTNKKTSNRNEEFILKEKTRLQRRFTKEYWFISTLIDTLTNKGELDWELVDTNRRNRL